MKQHTTTLAEALDMISRETSSADMICSACNSLRKFGTDPSVLRDSLENATSLLRERIRQHAENSAVQKCAAMALASLGEKRDLRSEVARSGCLAEMLSAWKIHVADESLAKDMLVSFRTMTTLEECRAATCELDGIDTTVSVMRKFSESESIQTKALALLVNLAFGSESSKLRISDIGGVHATLQAMKRFNSLQSAKLQEKGCTLLRNMSACSPKVSQAIAREDGIGILSSVAEKYRSDTKVLGQCMSALVNMADSSVATFRDALTFPSLMALLSRLVAMTLPQSETYAHFHDLSLKLIGILSVGDVKTQRVVGDNDLIFNIVSVMRCHVEISRQQSLGNNGERAMAAVPKSSSYVVLRRGAMVLRSLAFLTENRRIYEEIDDSMNVLLNSIGALRYEPMAVEQGLLALANMIFDSGKGKAKLSSCKGVSTVMSIMAEFRHISSVQEACCLALRASCEGSNENSRAAVDLGGFRTSVRILKTFPENSVIPEHALAVGIVLLQNCNCIKEQEKVNFHEEAISAAKRFPFNVVLRAQRDLACELTVGKMERPSRGSRTSLGQLIHRMSSSKRSGETAINNR